MLDTAFEALKKFDWGSDLAALNPIEDAAIAAHEKPEVGKDLESRLVAALQSELSLDAQEYVCRKLAMVGTAAAVPSLAVLLVKKEISHMARFALERIPAAEAAQALRDALPKVSGPVKIGVISSLGARRDSAAVATLSTCSRMAIQRLPELRHWHWARLAMRTPLPRCNSHRRNRAATLSL